MTFEIAADAPKRTHSEVERLHELAVNEFGYHTDHVLFSAHSDGTISGQIALDVGSDRHDREGDGKEERTLASQTRGWDTDRDPDPPGVGAGTDLSPSTGATSDSGGVSA